MTHRPRDVENRDGATGPGGWMGEKLSTQGYRLSDAERSGIGLIAGFTPRHPFDLLWNHGLRHLTDAPELPPNPPARRHAFKLATVWLLAVAALFAAGQDIAALST